MAITVDDTWTEMLRGQQARNCYAQQPGDVWLKSMHTHESRIASIIARSSSMRAMQALTNLRLLIDCVSQQPLGSGA
jgi:hypothetical protein